MSDWAGPTIKTIDGGRVVAWRLRVRAAARRSLVELTFTPILSLYCELKPITGKGSSKSLGL